MGGGTAPGAPVRPAGSPAGSARAAKPGIGHPPPRPTRPASSGSVLDRGLAPTRPMLHHPRATLVSRTPAAPRVRGRGPPLLATAADVRAADPSPTRRRRSRRARRSSSTSAHFEEALRLYGRAVRRLPPPALLFDIGHATACSATTSARSSSSRATCATSPTPEPGRGRAAHRGGDRQLAEERRAREHRRGAAEENRRARGRAARRRGAGACGRGARAPGGSRRILRRLVRRASPPARAPRRGRRRGGGVGLVPPGDGRLLQERTRPRRRHSSGSSRRARRGTPATSSRSTATASRPRTSRPASSSPAASSLRRG